LRSTLYFGESFLFGAVCGAATQGAQPLTGGPVPAWGERGARILPGPRSPGVSSARSGGHCTLVCSLGTGSCRKPASAPGVGPWRVQTKPREHPWCRHPCSAWEGEMGAGSSLGRSGCSVGSRLGAGAPELAWPLSPWEMLSAASTRFQT